MANIVEILLRAIGGDQVSNELGKTKKSTDELSKAFEKLRSYLTVGFLIKGIKDSLQAFSEQEVAVTKLNASLRLQGIYTRELSESFLKQASDLQDLTGFNDEAITSGQALAMSMGVTASTIQKITPLLLDFASTMGIDLQTAFSVVAKANLGENETLKRYGIIVDESELKSKGFNAVLEKMQENFQGTAEEIRKSGVGSLKDFNVKIEETKEIIGEALIPVFKALNDTLNEFGGALQNKEIDTQIKLQKELKEALNGTNLSVQDRHTLQKLSLSYNKKISEASKMSLADESNRIRLLESAKEIEEKGIKIILNRSKEEQKSSKIRVKLSEEEQKKLEEYKEEKEKKDKEEKEKEKKRTEEIAEKEKEELENRRAEFQNFLNALSDAGNAFYELEKVNIDNAAQRDISSATSRYEMRKAKIEAEIVDEDEKATKLAELEEGYQAEVSNIRSKAEDEARREREKLKPLMVAEAFANTALGATKALAQAGFPLGIVTAALISAAGAAQIAKIERQKFQFGGVVPGAKGEPSLAVVHGGEEILTPERRRMAGAGAAININISGNFIEGDQTKWDRMMRERIFPSMQRFLKKTGEGFSGA